jgi:pimeloyl-ACP methyl ester carboxylesterase
MPETLNHYQLGKGSVNLLFLHGLASDSGFWLPLISMIDKSKYTIHSIDLKGHGKSSFYNKNFLPSQLSHEVNESLIKYDLNDFILVCHSYGGRVGLNMLLSGTSSLAPSQLLILDTYWPEYQQRPSLQSVLERSADSSKIDPVADNVPVSATHALNLMHARLKKTTLHVKQKRSKNLAAWENIIIDERLCQTIDSQVDEHIDLKKLKKLHGKVKLVYGGDSLFLASGQQASMSLGLDLHIIDNARHFFPRFQAAPLAELINELKI